MVSNVQKACTPMEGCCERPPSSTDPDTKSQYMHSEWGSERAFFIPTSASVLSYWGTTTVQMGKCKHICWGPYMHFHSTDTVDWLIYISCTSGLSKQSRYLWLKIILSSLCSFVKLLWHCQGGWHTKSYIASPVWISQKVVLGIAMDWPAMDWNRVLEICKDEMRNPSDCQRLEELSDEDVRSLRTTVSCVEMNRESQVWRYDAHKHRCECRIFFFHILSETYLAHMSLYASKWPNPFTVFESCI